MTDNLEQELRRQALLRACKTLVTEEKWPLRDVVASAESAGFRLTDEEVNELMKLSKQV